MSRVINRGWVLKISGRRKSFSIFLSVGLSASTVTNRSFPSLKAASQTLNVLPPKARWPILLAINDVESTSMLCRCIDCSSCSTHHIPIYNRNEFCESDDLLLCSDRILRRLYFPQPIDFDSSISCGSLGDLRCWDFVLQFSGIFDSFLSFFSPRFPSLLALTVISSVNITQWCHMTGRAWVWVWNRNNERYQTLYSFLYFPFRFAPFKHLI